MAPFLSVARENFEILTIYMKKESFDPDELCQKLRDVDPEPYKLGFFKTYLDVGYADFTINHAIKVFTEKLEFPM